MSNTEHTTKKKVCVFFTRATTVIDRAVVNYSVFVKEYRGQIAAAPTTMHSQCNERKEIKQYIIQPYY